MGCAASTAVSSPSQNTISQQERNNNHNNDYSNELKTPTPTQKSKTVTGGNNNQQHVRNNDYNEVDTHALKTPKSARTSTKELAQYLIKCSSEDILRVRCFYRWITDNIRYDTESYFGNTKREVDAESVLTCGTSVCAGYANLFAELCKHADIKVEIISGYSKGYGYNADNQLNYHLETNHAWNAVLINNKWRFIECTWGAGFLDNNHAFQKQFNDFYFFTDPKHFIVNHFPYMKNDIKESTHWQLLDNPWSIEEYSKAVNPSHHALRWELKLPNNEGVIFMKNEVVITIEDPKMNMVDMTVKFQSEYGENFTQYAFLRREDTGIYKVTVRPPQVGKYLLKLFGKVNKNEVKLNEIVTYIVKCNSTGDEVHPYPKHSGLWGATQSALEIGFHSSVMDNVLYKAKKGNLILQLKIKEPILSMVRLQSSTSKEDLERYCLIETTNTYISIQLRLPTAGYYGLEVMCKTEDSELYHTYISYLIYSDKTQDKEVACFPETYPNTQMYQCSLIAPLDGEIPANETVTVRFKSPKIKHAMVGKCSMLNNNGIWEATIKTPEVGKKFQISGNDSDENLYWGLYNYTIV